MEILQEDIQAGIDFLEWAQQFSPPQRRKGRPPPCPPPEGDMRESTLCAFAVNYYK